MAISHRSQLGQRVQRGYQSRQACAKSLPVTIPKRAESTCRKIAMKLAIATTHSKSYLCFAPAARSVPQLPGSMYPTLTSSAGPTYARQLRQNSEGLSGTDTELWMPSSETGEIGRVLPPEDCRLSEENSASVSKIGLCMDSSEQ